MRSLLSGRPCRLAAMWLLACTAWAHQPATAQAPAVAPSNAPALLLAEVWRPGLPLQDYWISEKYDGVRGYWNGQQLLSRGGQAISAPAWFTAGWPATSMDGELWAGRGQFAKAQSTTAQATPDEAAWRGMRFMVFDLPEAAGTFDERLPRLQAAVARIAQPWVVAVPQQKLSDEKELTALLGRTVRAGGEGLMLHRGDSLYRGGRSGDLLKHKPYEDAEARIIGYRAGQGRWQGMTGALLVQAPDGRRFSLGSGLNAAQRARPPAIGSWVTYRYQGLHASGLPRFARFIRVRDEIGLLPPGH